MSRATKPGLRLVGAANVIGMAKTKPMNADETFMIDAMKCVYWYIELDIFLIQCARASKFRMGAAVGVLEEI